MRKKFSTVRIVRHWNSVSREIVDVPCLAVFKARLDGVPSNQVRWKVSLLMAGGLERDEFKIPLNSGHSVTPWKLTGEYEHNFDSKLGTKGCKEHIFKTCNKAQGVGECNAVKMELSKCLCFSMPFTWGVDLTSAKTCLKMKQLMKNENDEKHVFTLCVCIALPLPQGMFLTCSSTAFRVHTGIQGLESLSTKFGWTSDWIG